MKAKKVSVAYMWMAIVFVTCLIASNIFEAKLISLGPISVTAGLLCFPISYIIGDVTTEVYGFSAARRVIWLSILSLDSLLALPVLRSQLL